MPTAVMPDGGRAGLMPGGTAPQKRNNAEESNMACNNCTWSKSNHTHPIARTLTCGNFTPKVVADRNARVVDPDRCVTCGEFYTPKTTKGTTKCKCDLPKPPRWVLAEANEKPLPAIVRYGN